MNRRMTLKLDDDDDIGFYDSRERLSTAVPNDMNSDGNDNFEDSRMSFSAASIKRLQSIEPGAHASSAMPNYDMWMAAPVDVKERRKRLFHDMGLESRKNLMASRKDFLASRRDLLKIASSKVPRAFSRKPAPAPTPTPAPAPAPAPSPTPAPTQASKATPAPSPAPTPTAAPAPAPATVSSPTPKPAPTPQAPAMAEPVAESKPKAKAKAKAKPKPEVKPVEVSTEKLDDVVDSSSSSFYPTAEQSKGSEVEHAPAPHSPRRTIVFLRSRSDSDIEQISRRTKQRKEEVFGPESKQRLTRTLSGQLVPSIRVSRFVVPLPGSPRKERHRSAPSSDGAHPQLMDNEICTFFLIKDLDTGRDFIVREFNENGLWNKLNDVETGKQLTLEEFEKSVGYSPFVKELMRRRLSTKVSKGPNSVFSKSFRSSKKKGAAFLKNIKGLLGEKDQDMSKIQWVEAHQQGKTHKEFSALHMSQEIQAHQGSILTIKFNPDGHFLASAGEDKVVHVWEVQECDVLSAMAAEDGNADGLSRTPSDMKKKGKENNKKGSTIPDHVKIPENVLALSEKPICTFEGHLDEVLDLSWSRNQLLLSSSMDKTVRMWDLESKSCLKMFAHNDYVTCVQFNPVNDDYFFSGSLDAKIRIWNVRNRQVVDWTDAREMVTAGCYSPDGQGVIAGSIQGNCRIYNINDCQLEHRLDILKKKNQSKKFPAFPAQPKKTPAGVQLHTGKITGFQFAPWSQSEVLITSTGSRIGIYCDSELIQKFKGFHNTSSQIAASFTPNGKHVISASEDSRVYMWKVDETKNNAANKKKPTVTVQAFEHFTCKDVSVAIPWPGSIKNEAPVMDPQSKKKRPGAPPVPKPSSPSPNLDDGSDNASAKKNLPPLPKKKSDSQKSASNGDEESAPSDQADPGNVPAEDEQAPNDPGASSSSEPASLNDSPSMSASQSFSSSSSTDPAANGNAGSTGQASAWGLAIVTASLEGEIRVYQNFGLPLKVSRPGYLF